MNRKYLFLLCLIVILAGILRFVGLSQFPPSLSHDEVAIGYNGWSIYQTGKDEYGKQFPLLFRSFDDYKLPGYIYVTSISQALFGINEFAVRFPSAFLGTLTVPCLFLLVLSMIKQKDIYFDSKKISAETFSLLCSFMLAISPWHINFSRAAFESNASLFFIVLGALFLFLSREKKWVFFLSALSFVASIYFYYTARVLVPGLLIVYALLYREEIRSHLKTAFIACLFGIILLLPLIPSMFTTGNARVSQVSIFESDIVRVPYWEAIVQNNFAPSAVIFFNKYMAYITHFSDNYLKNFNLDYYFSNGTGPMGLLYLWEIPFFFLGIVLLLKNRRWGYFVLLWFFTVPLVGGLTVGQPNALRTLPNSIPASIFTSYGLLACFIWISKKRWYKPVIIIGVGIFLFFFVRFLSLYFLYTSHETAEKWGDGHKQLASYLTEHADIYDNVYVTGANWRPYIYMLYYMKYPPQRYIEDGNQNSFSNLSFGSADWDEDTTSLSDSINVRLKNNDSMLIVLTPFEYEEELKKIQRNEVPYSFQLVEIIDGTYITPRFVAVTIVQEE